MGERIYTANDRLKRELFSWYKEYLQNFGHEDGCCTDDKFNADSHLANVVEMIFLETEGVGEEHA